MRHGLTIRRVGLLREQNKRDVASPSRVKGAAVFGIGSGLKKGVSNSSQIRSNQCFLGFENALNPFRISKAWCFIALSANFIDQTAVQLCPLRGPPHTTHG
uniref:Uncharacterized protein n=1 Tax=Panagrellus redivivus TaxID=6233 RepID=A0A7E4US53_PANRE